MQVDRNRQISVTQMPDVEAETMNVGSFGIFSSPSECDMRLPVLPTLLSVSKLVLLYSIANDPGQS